MSHDNASRVINLPRPRNEYDPAWASRLVRDVQSILTSLSRPSSTGWSVSNSSDSRTLDVSAATLAELRAVVGTLIDELKHHGILAS